MKIYVINLDRRTDRLQKNRTQFELFNLDFERVAAVDGRADGFVEQHPDTKLAPPEYACYLSHRKVWELIVKSGDAFGLVMEDDVILAPSFKTVIEHKPFYETVDILHFETWPLRCWIEKTPDYKFAGIASRAAPYPPLGTGCYVISREYAQRLLDEIGVLNVPIDKWLFDKRFGTKPAGKILHLDPAPAIQECFYGTGGSISYKGSDIRQSTLDRKAAEFEHRGIGAKIWFILSLRTRRMRRKIYRSFFLSREFRKIPFDDRL